MLYGESCVPTSHNSFASSSNGFIIWPQQHLSIKDQLQIGVRGFMLDTHADSERKAVVLKHGSSNINGIAKPITGEDILFYDIFKEFTNFLEYQLSKQKCATVTVLLENYVPNSLIYRVINKEGFADKYLYKMNPNSANLDDMCNKIVLFTSHTKDAVTGIHPPGFYKENHYKYYESTTLLHYNIPHFLRYEECEERLEGRAKYDDPNINIFCFNHFSPISALIEMNILVKPLLHNFYELLDQGLEMSRIPYKIALAQQEFSKSYDSLQSLSTHLNYCKSRDIKDKFYPTIIAIDFIEKESGVFLCYKDEDCSGARCYFPSEEKGFFSKIYEYFFEYNTTDSHEEL